MKHVLDIGSIDEVPASFVVRVHQLKALLLIHRSHPDLLPFVSNAHTPEGNGGDMNTGEGRELTVTTELRCGLWVLSNAIRVDVDIWSLWSCSRGVSCMRSVSW